MVPLAGLSNLLVERLYFAKTVVGRCTFLLVVRCILRHATDVNGSGDSEELLAGHYLFWEPQVVQFTPSPVISEHIAFD